MNGARTVRGPCCKAVTNAGKPCRALAGAERLCTAHSGKQDMRELGRRSGQARCKPDPARVHPSLREYLKAEVTPAEVWQALKAVLEGDSETARVSASRVLLDALAEEQREGDLRQEMEQATAEAREYLTTKLDGRAERYREQLRAELHEQLREQATKPVAEELERLRAENKALKREMTG